MPTPFRSDFGLDEEAFRKELKFVVDHHLNGVLVNGSTGEFATLSVEERRRTVRIAREVCGDRLFVLAGVETPATREMIQEIERVREDGADFALVSCPYYLKPTTEGVFTHYKKAAEVGFPILLYNNPFRTDVNLSREMVSRLAEIKNVVGIKQSNGDLSQTADFISTIGDKISFIHSYGDSVSLFPGLLMGGAACMIPTSLFVPDEVLELYRAVKAGDIAKAKTVWTRILPLLKSTGGGVEGEPNPSALKEGLRLIGRSVGPTRLPVVPVSPKTTKLLQSLLEPYAVAH
jgi:4-hydroxy-tetrahydrodipicolinate synthase